MEAINKKKIFFFAIGKRGRIQRLFSAGSYLGTQVMRSNFITMNFIPRQLSLFVSFLTKVEKKAVFTAGRKVTDISPMSKLPVASYFQSKSIR